MACVVVAGLLHYFFLCVFCWMLLEGVQLYLMVVQVFNTHSLKHWHIFLLGYGLPAVLVGISAAINSKGYSRKKWVLNLDPYPPPAQSWAREYLCIVHWRSGDKVLNMNVSRFSGACYARIACEVKGLSRQVEEAMLASLKSLWHRPSPSTHSCMTGSKLS